MIGAMRLIMLVLLVAVSASSAGCGGGSSTASGDVKGRVDAREGGGSKAPGGALPAGVVASFQGSDITEPNLDHWIAIEAATIYEDIPKRRLPAGVIPDPPAFAACVAYLRSSPAQKGHGPRTNAELLSECRANYRRLRSHALSILISFSWLEAEAKKLGIKVSEHDVTSEFERFREEVFGSRANYQRFLLRTGQTLADEYLRMRMDLNTRALTKHFTSEGAAAFIRYSRDYPRSWASETTCRPADVVPNCREYRGGTAPEAIL